MSRSLFCASRQLTGAANDLEGLSTELPSDINDRKFGIQNIDRLLKKFYLAVFPTDVVPDPDDKVKT